MSDEKDIQIRRLTKQVARLASLVEASRVLNSALPEDTLISTILGIATDVMDAQASVLIVQDRVTGELRCDLVLADRPGLVKEAILESPEGIPAQVIREGRAIAVNTPEADSGLPSPIAGELGLKPTSLLCVPLHSRDRTIGAIEVLNKRGTGVFDEHDTALFMAFADQVGVAIRNAELYGEVRRKALERELLLDLERRLIDSLDTREVMRRILELTRKIVPYDAGSILVYDLKSGRMRDMVSHGYDEDGREKLDLKFGEGIAGWAAKSGEAILVKDVRLDPRYVDARPSTRAEMAVPLKKGTSVLGVFNLESDRLGAYTEADLALAESFANHAAIALDNARLHGEVKNARALQNELRVARRIQQMFLPKHDPVVPGFDISGRAIPSREVGGDYYDFIPIDEHNLAIVIADVAGKGVPAGLILASFRASLLTEARESASPGEILANVNYLLCKSTDPSDFVTAFLGILDLRTRRVTFTNAGHNYPYVLRAHGGVERLIDGGTLLGIIKGATFQEGTVDLDEGDLVVLFTDGITEAVNRGGEQFGEERLERLIAATRHLAAREIGDAIFEEVRRFASGVQRFDDMAFVAMKAH